MGRGRPPQIVAYGGGGFSMEPSNPLLDEYVLGLCRRKKPKVCFFPSASGDADHYVVRFYRHFSSDICDPSHISLFRRDCGPGQVREHLLKQDMIYVGGGSILSLLGVWRAHGIDEDLRAAWQAGVILVGVSAGSLCWFASGLTAYHHDARPYAGLGFLPHSNAVHYEEEPGRRPASHAALRDERGQIIHDDRALLVVMDLVAAERHSGRVALPVTTTRVAEQVAAFHGVDLVWTGTAGTRASPAPAAPDVVFAGDGRGGFVVPEFSAAVDGIAAFVRLLGLVARTKLTMSEIDARIPRAAVLRRALPTPWAAKGAVMRAVLEAAGDREVDTTDGVRVVEPDGRWVLVLPDPAEAVTHLWAEASTEPAAARLLDAWSAVVESSHA